MNFTLWVDSSIVTVDVSLDDDTGVWVLTEHRDCRLYKTLGCKTERAARAHFVRLFGEYTALSDQGATV